MQSASDTNVPWLTRWDEQMIGYLDPLAKHNSPPKMQLLFFANTFPLAYHYALALRMQNKAAKNLRSYINIGLWKKGANKDFIHYTNTRTKGRDSQIAVTLFNPRWAFVPLTLSTSRIWESMDKYHKDEEPGAPRPLGKFLNAAKDKYDRLWIYSGHRR